MYILHHQIKDSIIDVLQCSFEHTVLHLGSRHDKHWTWRGGLVPFLGSKFKTTGMNKFTGHSSLAITAKSQYPQVFFFFSWLRMYPFIVPSHSEDYAHTFFKDFWSVFVNLIVNFSLFLSPSSKEQKKVFAKTEKPI